MLYQVNTEVKNSRIFKKEKAALERKTSHAWNNNSCKTAGSTV
jgi:hypothetical protein